MQTKNHFSFQRFLLLIRLSVRVNKRLLLISIAGLAGTLFLALILFQSMVNFQNWNQSNNMITFYFLFLTLGFLYTSQSFPAFRSNTKSLAFLMLPATNSEKYSFELLTRVVAYIVLMPLIFWIVANIEGVIVHHYVPQLVNYKFSFTENISRFIERSKPGFWGIFGTVQAMLFVFTTAFTGSSYFSKSPLIKTLFTFSTIVAGYFLFSYLLFRGLNLKQYHPADSSMYISKNGILMLFAIAGSLINFTLLAISWFRLKEKEA
jgi:hypothetical protein